MTVDYTHQANYSGMDEIVNNNRVRAGVAQGQAQGTMWMQGTGTPTSSASATGITLTAAMLGGGLIIHNPGASNSVTDTTDTAANIFAYMLANSAGVNVGDILQVESVTNAGTGTSVITVAGGTGVTLDANGTGTIPTGVQKTLNFRCTAIGASPTFTLYM